MDQLFKKKYTAKIKQLFGEVKQVDITNNGSIIINSEYNIPLARLLDLNSIEDAHDYKVADKELRKIIHNCIYCDHSMMTLMILVNEQKYTEKQIVDAVLPALLITIRLPGFHSKFKCFYEVLRNEKSISLKA